MRRLITLVAGAMVFASSAARAQTWKSIGTTTQGNPVYIRPSTLKRHGDTVTVVSEVRYKTPVIDGKNHFDAVRTLASFNCKTGKFAGKETTYFTDVKANIVYQHKVNPKPGYGEVLGGSLTQIVRDYVCAQKKP